MLFNVLAHNIDNLIKFGPVHNQIFSRTPLDEYIVKGKWKHEGSIAQDLQSWANKF